MSRNGLLQPAVAALRGGRGRLAVYVSGSDATHGNASGGGCSSGNPANSSYPLDTSSVITTTARTSNVYVRVSATNNTSNLSVTYSLA